MITWWLVGLGFYLVLGSILMDMAFKLVKEDNPTLYAGVGNFIKAFIFIFTTCLWPLLLLFGFFVSRNNR